jgi:amino acid permease
MEYSVPDIPATPLLTDDGSPAPHDDGTPKKVGMFGSWVVVMNLIIGLGILSIPYCLKTGIFTNAIILVVIGLLSYFSLVILIDSALAIGIPIDYAKLMAIAVSPKAKWFPHFVIFVII